jgi:hypothetical protein
MNEQSSGAQAAASRPGLKPVADLFKGAWEQYKQHASVLIGIMLISGIGAYLQSILLFTGNGARVNQYGQATPAGLASIGILGLIVMVISIVAALWGYSALLNRISKLNQPMSIKQAYMTAKPLIWPLFLTGLLVGIFTLIGFILLIIPGIVVGVFLSFALYIVIDENKSGMDAVKASKAYVDGYWLPVFGRIFLMGVALVVVMMIVGFIFGMLFDGRINALIQNIISLAITPFAVLYMYDLYHNVKQVKGGSVAAVTAPSAPVM